jgi:hypothetical protein
LTAFVAVAFELIDGVVVVGEAERAASVTPWDL